MASVGRVCAVEGYNPPCLLSRRKRVVGDGVRRVCAVEGEGITLPVCCQSRQYRKKERKKGGHTFVPAVSVYASLLLLLCAVYA